METLELKTTKTISERVLHKMCSSFAARASQHDLKGEFVFENYADLKANKFFSLMIPEDLGGSGLSHSEVCKMVKEIGKYCGSTALAFSMHQHLVAASVWKYKHKNVGEELLKRIANEQLVLVSTGARDWLGSNGTMTKVEGGYHVSARKAFASQSAHGDILVTSAPFRDEEGKNKVLHFAVPFKAPGLSLCDDWNVLGMRATGSQTVELRDVFVPESVIALERTQNDFHPVWNVVLTVAMPLIMSAYIGIAERALEICTEKMKTSRQRPVHAIYALGNIQNEFLGASVQWEAMLKRAADLNFQPDKKISSEILSLKTNVSNSCRKVVRLCMELLGGMSYYQDNELERLLRDVEASQFHPLPKWAQFAFTGEELLN